MEDEVMHKYHQAKKDVDSFARDIRNLIEEFERKTALVVDDIDIVRVSTPTRVGSIGWLEITPKVTVPYDRT